MSTSIHNASPLQLAELTKRRDRMRRIAERAFQASDTAPAVIEPTMALEPVDVIALMPEDPTPVPASAVHVSWFGERISIEKIKRAVAEQYGLSSTEMDSNRRTAKIVWPRQIAMFLSKKMTTLSFPQIGRRFNDKDHTTVLHACRKIEQRLNTDHELADEIQALRLALGA